MIVEHVKDGLRAGAAAVGVAASLMVLASTSQTPDGFIHASFGGPMDVFSPGRASDILAIGDGTADDASELAALLKGPASPTAEMPDSPIRAAFEAGTTTSPAAPLLVPSISPTVPPTLKDAATLPVKPVVDAQGKVDCTGSVSCKTDPTTNVTTVTYPDGIVAIVQKVNDLTVVAYKSLTDVLPDEVAAWLPPVPEPGQVFLGSPAVPTATQAVTPPSLPTAAAVPVPSPEITTPSFDPGPIAPVTGIPDSEDSRRGPRVNVVRPPMDFSPDSDTGGSPSTGGQKPNFPVLGKMKDALGSAVDAVTDAVGKAINPGASNRPPGSGESRGGSGSSGP